MSDWFTHPLPHGLDEEAKKADFWPTPRSAIESLLDSDPPIEGSYILEPCAGDGAIVRVLLERGYRVDAVEIRDKEIVKLVAMCGTVLRADFLELSARYLARDHRLIPPFVGLKPLHDADAIITNPPFSIARAFATCCLKIAERYVALLLRMNVLGSSPWANFWLANPPSAIRPLRKRPSFSGDGKTDACEYGWFIWDERPPMDIKPI